jgi:hypothetical protein
MLLVKCEKGGLIHCWQKFKSVQPLWKSAWRVLKTLKVELAFDTAIPLLGKYLEEFKSTYCRDTCTPIVIVILLTIAKLCNQPRCPSTNEWIKSIWHICTM